MSEPRDIWIGKEDVEPHEYNALLLKPDPDKIDGFVHFREVMPDDALELEHQRYLDAVDTAQKVREQTVGPMKIQLDRVTRALERAKEYFRAERWRYRIGEIEAIERGEDEVKKDE